MELGGYGVMTLCNCVLFNYGCMEFCSCGVMMLLSHRLVVYVDLWICGGVKLWNDGVMELLSYGFVWLLIC